MPRLPISGLGSHRSRTNHGAIPVVSGRVSGRLCRAASVLAALCIAAAARADLVIPTDGMVITEDTTFAPGAYNLPNGVSIGASGVTLNMNGAELLGTDFQNYGVRCEGFDNVTIHGGAAHGYYYGMLVRDGANVRILDNDLSGNWVDPASLGPNAPFLNINVGPDLGDRTNLGGGLFVQNATLAEIARNTLTGQENGIDLYFVTSSVVSSNDTSGNTGWGIHLYASTENLISGNLAERCIRAGLGDSAGMLLVYGSSRNQVLNNSMQYCGDGFFIGNEHGCPSNDNLVQSNDASFAGANAFEATFSSGNQFILNIADYSNYGFWLGYSHTGNVIRGNSIRRNNVAGIEIEHGQHNVIEGNEIVGNGGRGIVLRTDGAVHFPPEQFPCLELPDQAASSHYTVRDNVVHSNFGPCFELTQTTDSLIVNNLFGGQFGGVGFSGGADNVWSVEPTPGANIVDGPTLGGNWWSNYVGTDLDADGLGDTDVPYDNAGTIAPPGDPHPLIGSPNLGDFDNPQTLCDFAWFDLGRNTRSDGAEFDTANGTHMATNGFELYLLEGANSPRLDLFGFATDRWIPRADAPLGAFDGSDLQFGGAVYYATFGLELDPQTGAGRGPRLFAYDPVADSWEEREPAVVDGNPVAKEALAYDPASGQSFATIVGIVDGADPSLRQRLAIYNPAADSWVGVTAEAPVTFNAGSEAEYLDGKVYVWRGGFEGGAVNGSDSYLNVYDLATDSWSATPALLDSGVIPGFRSGAFDVWGVTITADANHGRLFVQGGENNRQVYVYDVAEQSWAVTRSAPYDGGWGDGMEYLDAFDVLYLIDGRNSAGTPQGTAVLLYFPGDLDGDGHIGSADLMILLSNYGLPGGMGCDDGDIDGDGDGDVDLADLSALLSAFGI